MKGRPLSLSLFALLLVLLAWGEARAQVIPNTPRALGMGNAFIAVSDDEGAIIANPAGLALVRKGMVSMGSLGLNDQEDHWYGSYIQPSGQGTVYGQALSYARTDNGLTNIRTERASWSAGLNYAQNVTVGLSLHYLRASNQVTGDNDKAFGTDLGVLYALPAMPGVRSLGTVGVLVQNPTEPRLLGATMPRVISVGVATRIVPAMLIAADSYNVFDEAGAPQERSVGVEFTPVSGLAFRGGYMTKAKVATAGVGIRGNDFHLDAGWAAKDGGQETGFVGVSFLF